MQTDYPIDNKTLTVNKTLSQTYKLLSATLLTTAIAAFLSIQMAVPQGLALGAMILAMLLGMFALPRVANNSSGIGLVFLISGLLGLSMGPMLTHYLSFANGSEIVSTAFFGTAAIFLSLSYYAITSKRDFSFLSSFLMAGMIVVLLAVIASLFLAMPLLNVAISAVVILLMTGYMLYETSEIVNRPETTNYVLATYSLYLAIFNMFTSILHLLAAFGGERD